MLSYNINDQGYERIKNLQQQILKAAVTIGPALSGEHHMIMIK